MNKPNTHPHLGFTFTDEEEERMRRAMQCAVLFMGRYGRGHFGRHNEKRRPINLDHYMQCDDHINYNDIIDQDDTERDSTSPSE